MMKVFRNAFSIHLGLCVYSVLKTLLEILSCEKQNVRTPTIWSIQQKYLARILADITSTNIPKHPHIHTHILLHTKPHPRNVQNLNSENNVTFPNLGCPWMTYSGFPTIHIIHTHTDDTLTFTRYFLLH